MFKVNILKEDNEICVRFDTPIPIDVEGNAVYRKMVEKLGACSSIKYERDASNNIISMRFSSGGWLEFVNAVMEPGEASDHCKNIDELFMKDVTMAGEGLSVNFHQKSLDNARRYWEFILNQPHFEDYFINRLMWFLYPEYHIVSHYPLHVDIETASTCNMNCPMCYRDMLSDTGQMELGTFKGIIDECEDKGVFSIRLSWRGEALSHPNIEEMIEYATSRIKNVSFLTNAFYLDEQKMECFIKNKVSYVAVSFDGMRDIYELVRKPASFDDSYNKLRKLKELKADQNSLPASGARMYCVASN